MFAYLFSFSFSFIQSVSVIRPVEYAVQHHCGSVPLTHSLSASTH